LAEKDPIERGGLEKKTPFLSRRVSSYVVCLLLAGLFWLLHSLSKEYIITVRVPVSYSHLPEQKLIAVDLPDSVDAEVIGSGFTILAYQWTHPFSPMDLDARQARSLGSGDFALATYSHSERLEGAIGHGLKILRVMPDTIVLSFEGRAEKRIPVRPKVTVKCAPMYRLGDSIKTIPAYVMVSGAEALVKRINYIETEPKNYQGLNKAVNEPVNLVLPPDLRQLTVSSPKVNLIVPVGQYTEKKFSIPVETINVPPNVVLKTFPDKVDVIFQVPVENFAAITADMFRVVADYSKIDPKANTIAVEFVRQPLNVLNLHTQPQRVEFLIRK
jgi:YbbR domain-containing protein